MRLEHLGHSVAPHLEDDGVDPVQDWVASPVCVDDFPGDGVEADCHHQLGEDGPVLYPPLVHAGALRLHLEDVDHPLQNFPLQLKIFL